MTRWVLVLLIALGVQGAVRAAVGSDAPPPGGDPALEAKVHRVSQELRCLVCQNQTIADSNAELAQDLRREVRHMLAAGSSEDDVRRFMVERYGDFVLYRPPLQSSTIALWVGPFLLLIVALWSAQRIVRARRRAIAAATTLTPDEQARLHALIGGPEQGARQ